MAASVMYTSSSAVGQINVLNIT
ncbi:hypothetical protein Rin_00014820, partial [Candidatus Regiella insecticola 5.15]